MTRPADVAVSPSARSPRVRSAISNGSRLPGGVSGTSHKGRRFNDIIHDLTAEMGGALTFDEQLRVRIVAGLVMHVEELQAAILRGEPVDSEQLTRESNSAARMLNALRRRPAPSRAKGNRLQAFLADRGAVA